MSKIDKAIAQQRARGRFVAGGIIGLAYGAALTLQFIDYRQARRDREAATARRLRELQEQVNGISFASVATAERVGMSEAELGEAAYAVYERKIEEAINGKTA